MELQQWLTSTLSLLVLEEECLGYLYRRGAKDLSISEMGFKTWKTLPTEAPCPKFRSQFGKCGEVIHDHLVYPLYAPSGKLLGFECRAITTKWIERYLIPDDYKWTPVFIGMDRALDKIWQGSDVWLVEGLFDLLAMEWVIPKEDAILATLRAKVTDPQLDFLSRFVRGRINLVYDRDKTGTKGTRRALKEIHERGLMCVEIPYRGGNDPGDIWDKSGMLGLRQAFNMIL